MGVGGLVCKRAWRIEKSIRFRQTFAEQEAVGSERFGFGGLSF